MAQKWFKKVARTVTFVQESWLYSSLTLLDSTACSMLPDRPGLYGVDLACTASMSRLLSRSRSLSVALSFGCNGEEFGAVDVETGAVAEGAVNEEKISGCLSTNHPPRSHAPGLYRQLFRVLSSTIPLSKTPSRLKSMGLRIQLSKPALMYF